MAMATYSTAPGGPVNHTDGIAGLPVGREFPGVSGLSPQAAPR